jgi:hypothetical protein
MSVYPSNLAMVGCVTARDRQDSRRNGIICLNVTISSYAPNDAKKAEDRNRNEVLGAALISTCRQEMAAAVAGHLVKAERENAGWWINLAYSIRRS